jgi:hypothetical protein
VKPLPAYVNRLKSGDVGRGENYGAYQVWPTSRPEIALEKGEKLAIPVRIRPTGSENLNVTLEPGSPWKLRKETSGDYWLDVFAESGAQATPQAAKLIVDFGSSHSEIQVKLKTSVSADNLVVTPKEIDFGELPVAGLNGSAKRFGLRKLVGSFHIKGLSSTLPFLKFEQATMVDGSNYLIKVSIDTSKAKPGSYAGTVVVETDEPHRVEVPVKIKILSN